MITLWREFTCCDCGKEELVPMKEEPQERCEVCQAIFDLAQYEFYAQELNSVCSPKNNERA